jgi:hypothetical protein
MFTGQACARAPVPCQMGTDGTFPLFSVSVNIGNKNYASNPRIYRLCTIASRE